MPLLERSKVNRFPRADFLYPLSEVAAALGPMIYAAEINSERK